MINVKVELSKLYSDDSTLKRGVLDEYKALGIEKLMQVVQDDVICASRNSTEPLDYIILNGNHKSRALLDLGYTGTVDIRYHGVFYSFRTEDNVLINDVPILGE